MVCNSGECLMLFNLLQKKEEDLNSTCKYRIFKSFIYNYVHVITINLFSFEVIQNVMTEFLFITDYEDSARTVETVLDKYSANFRSVKIILFLEQI